MANVSISENNNVVARDTMWRIVVESTNGLLVSYPLTFHDGDTPTAVMQELKTVYKKHVSKKRRIFNRFVLLHKPVVELVTLSTAIPIRGPSARQQVFMSARGRDDALTAAFYKPCVLNNVDPSAFFTRYGGLFVQPGDQPDPNHAILVSSEADRRAMRLMRIVGLVISLGFNIGLGIGL